MILDQAIRCSSVNTAVSKGQRKNPPCEVQNAENCIWAVLQPRDGTIRKLLQAVKFGAVLSVK